MFKQTFVAALSFLCLESCNKESESITVSNKSHEGVTTILASAQKAAASPLSIPKNADNSVNDQHVISDPVVGAYDKVEPTEFSDIKSLDVIKVSNNTYKVNITMGNMMCLMLLHATNLENALYANLIGDDDQDGSKTPYPNQRNFRDSPIKMTFSKDSIIMERFPLKKACFADHVLGHYIYNPDEKVRED